MLVSIQSTQSTLLAISLSPSLLLNSEREKKENHKRTVLNELDETLSSRQCHAFDQAIMVKDDKRLLFQVNQDFTVRLAQSRSAVIVVVILVLSYLCSSPCNSS
jgi:hypothetical protein